jgi:hypothetical protein
MHELTHGTQKQMREQYHTPGAGKQFTDAYAKLMGVGPNAGPEAVTKKMAPQWNDEGKLYRTTPNELQAHAVGNMSPMPHPSMGAPAHVDPTLATEFMILLDLATRDQAQQKKGASK